MEVNLLKLIHMLVTFIVTLNNINNGISSTPEGHQLIQYYKCKVDLSSLNKYEFSDSRSFSFSFSSLLILRLFHLYLFFVLIFYFEISIFSCYITISFEHLTSVINSYLGSLYDIIYYMTISLEKQLLFLFHHNKIST